MRTWVLLLSSILAGCSGDTDDKTTPGDDDDDTDVSVETADTGPTAPAAIDIVAVGFEVQGVIEADGSFGSFVIDGNEYPPQVLVTFTDLDYFSLSGDAQIGHYCTAFGLFGDDPNNPVTPLVKPDQIETRSLGVLIGEPGADFDNALLYASYETTLYLDTSVSECAGLVDAEKWGEDAEILFEAFNGARFGFGFGAMTDYMRAGWDPQDLTDYGDQMIAQYIAINDQNGDFHAYDWATGLVWQSDPDTNEVLFEADGKTYLGPVVTTGTPVGGDLPEGYVVSYALWYQDFQQSDGSKGLDLTNLKDGAPAGD